MPFFHDGDSPSYGQEDSDPLGAVGPVFIALVGVLVGGFLAAKAPSPTESTAPGKRRLCFIMAGVQMCMPLLYVLLVTLMSNLPKMHAGPNVRFAATHLMGLSAASVSIFIGYFAQKWITCTMQQPRIFVGGVLVIIFIQSQALFGLIISLSWVGTSKKHGDFNSSSDAFGLMLSTGLGVAASAGASAVAGGCAMELGVETPHYVMKGILPVICGSIIGIIALVSSLVQYGSSEGFNLKSLCFVGAGWGIALSSNHFFPKLIHESGEMLPQMFNQLLLACAACTGLAFVGFAMQLFVGEPHLLFGAKEQPFQELAATDARGAMMPLAILAVTASAAFAVAFRRRSADSSMASPLIQ